ncbi:TonB-dependent receptor [Alteromonadaceae bacterium BrNp21-10]|nr:TonB-dependent receptor [Alteromonadaceae bacterium BrNp21-10]
MTLIRTFSVVALLCCCQYSYATSWQHQVVEFNIKDRRAEISLLQFAEQSNLSFFMSYDVVVGVKTNPVVGQYSIQQALEILLMGSALNVELDKSGRLSMVKAEHVIVEKPIVEPEVVADKMEVVEVTALEGELPNHLQIKRMSKDLQERISTKQLANQPKKNLAESLQRSSGVSINRNVGEGGEVSVRGFGPHYNVTTVNGRTIASSKPNRNFDFRLLPSDFVNNINIVKSAPADLTAGSIGANIDIRTAKPFDFSGFHADSTFSLNTSKLKPDLGYHYSALFSYVPEDRNIGFMLGFLNEQSEYRIDRYTTQRLAQSNILPENLQLPVLDTAGEIVTPTVIRRPLRMINDVQTGEKQRSSINSVLQWKTQQTGLHTLDVIYAKLDRDSFSSGVQYPGQSPNFKDVVVDQNNSLISATIFNSNIDAVFEEQIEDIDTLAVGYNFKFMLADWWINFDLSHSRAKAYEMLNALIPHYVGNEDGSFINLDFTNDGVLSSTTNIPFSDPSLIRAHWNGKREDELEDNVNELKVDSRYLFDDGVMSELNVGISIFQREKSNQQYKWNDDYQCAPCGGLVDLPDELFQVVLYPNFLDDQLGDRPKRWLKLTNINYYNSTIQAIMEKNGIITSDKKWHETVFDPSASYSNTERSISLYSKLNFSGEQQFFDWNGNLGLRYLSLTNIADGYLQHIQRIALDPNSSQNELRLKLEYSQAEATQSENHDEHFLLSGNVNFDFLNGFIIKLAAAQVISFPQIEYIGVNQKFTSDDSGSVLLFEGNPDLKPYSATQYDFSVEYYADSGNAFSVAFFYKNIDTYISTSTFERAFQGEVSDAVLARREHIVEIVNRNENIDGGTILGAELSGRLSFDTFCDFCQGLTFEANYTRILNNQMNADPIRLDSVKEPQSVIEGLSEQSFNWNLAYANEAFRALLAYSWRSSFLHSRQGIRTGGIPEHTDAYGQLDARLSFNFTPTFELFAEAYNISNTPHLEYADVRSRITHLEHGGISYQLGLRKVW